MKHRRVLFVAAVCVVLVIAAAVALFVVPWPDANHQGAVQTVQNAGVQGG